MMHDCFVREAVKSVVANASVEIALRDREMRGNFGHGVMEGVIEAGELSRARENGLRRSDERQCLWNVKRGKMCGGAQFVQKLRGDELMGKEIRSAVNDAMSDRDRSGVSVLLNFFGERGEGIS